MKESLKFFINLYGSPKVLYSDLLLCYHIGFDEFFFFFIRTYIYYYYYYGIRATLFWPVIVLLCSLSLRLCLCPKLWCSVVVSPSYRRWRHPSRKVNS